MTTSTKVGLPRFYEYRDRWRGILSQLEQAPTEQQNPVLMALIRLVLENDEKTIECAEKGIPFVSSWYGNAPEICAAMGVHVLGPVDNLLAHQLMTNLYDLEECDKMPLADDICSLVRLAAYGVEKGLVPTPTAVIDMMQPCDGQQALHNTYMNHELWGKIPHFPLDPPYGSTEEDYKYFADQLKQMTVFLEKVTGQKYDVNKLREVVEETNQQYEVWAEYNELRRAVPCPGGSFEGSSICWGVTQHIRAGHPKATALMQMLLAATEQRIKDGKGFLENEKIRILWPDLAPTWAEPLGEWLAKEWNANVVMDFQGYTPYTTIDTSTEESMLIGLARRSLNEVPMIRQARGTIDNMIEDVTRIIKDYSINCVIFPGHMGHKDQAATVAFLRQICRDMNVPFLPLTTSLFDPRYMPVDKLKKEIAAFFDAHGLGK